MSTTKKKFILKPGILVIISTRQEGGVTYKRVDLEADAAKAEGSVVTRWETTKVVEDPDENKRAGQVLSKAANTVRRMCTPSGIGGGVYYCGIDAKDDLAEVTATAKAMVAKFNEEDAKTTRISLRVNEGIITSAAEANRTMAIEIRDSIEKMQASIENLNAKDARAAAADIVSMIKSIDDEAAKVAKDAVDEARAAITAMVKKMSTGDVVAAQQIAAVPLASVVNARQVFLDLGELDLDGPATVTTPVALEAAAEIDMGEEEEESGGGRGANLAEESARAGRSDEGEEMAASKSVEIDGVTLNYEM